MNKNRLAKTIIETIDNFRSIGDSEADILEAVESYLDTLEPKDRDRFSQWGKPEDKSTPEKCWE